nr:MAG TPA: hypothetical protein [Caudoviricetes sp.]
MCKSRISSSYSSIKNNPFETIKNLLTVISIF